MPLSHEELAKCVEDSIANQLDNFNEASGKDFCDIEELYTAYMDADKMIKDQDLHIIQLEMKNEKDKKEIKLLKDMIYDLTSVRLGDIVGDPK